MKRLHLISTFFTLGVMLLFNCENSTGPDPEIIPKIEEFSNSGLPPYFDISGQTIYVALGYQGLWKRPLEAGNDAWEHVAFYDSTKKTTVEDVSANGDDLLIARLNGIWRSLDGGDSWSPSDSGLCPEKNYFWVYQIRRSPDNPNRIAAQVDAALYISSDNGNTWQNTNGNCGSSTISEWGIRWHPNRNGELWYKVADHYIILTNYGAFLKLIIDIGNIYGPSQMNFIESLAFSQTDPDTVIMQTSRELYVTGDSGFNWQELSLPDSIKYTSNIREIPEKPGYYLIKKYDIKQYLFYTTDNFKTIKTYKVIDDPDTIIWNPTDEFHFYQGNLYLSTNKGIESIPISEFE